MKAIQFTTAWKKFVLVVSILLVVITFSSCSNKTIFNTSSIIPAARGDVKVKIDKNKNYTILLELSYLAEPERLQPAKKSLCSLVGG